MYNECIRWAIEILRDPARYSIDDVIEAMGLIRVRAGVCNEGRAV